MLIENVFNFNTADIFSTRNNDVFAAVFQLNVTIRMNYSDVTGMEPAACKSLCCSFRIFEIAFHDYIPLHQYFSHCFTVSRNRFQCFRIRNCQSFQHMITHTLPAFELCLSCFVFFVPSLLPFTYNSRTINFRQPINMCNIKSGFFHLGNNSRRRRCGSRHNFYPVRQFPLLFFRRIADHVHHNRCTAKMSNMVFSNRVINVFCSYFSQTDMCPAQHCDCPRETPAVAMKHRQSPEIYRAVWHFPGQHIPGCQQISSACVVNYTFRNSSCSGCVIQ